MASKIKLVKDDTGPQIVFSLKDAFTDEPIDLSNIGTSLTFFFRAVGSTTLKDTITMSKLTGLQNDDGSITTTAPYDTAGRGGRCAVPWNATSLDTVGEFEGEIQITFNDGTVQTVYDIQKFSIRADF